MMNKELTRLRGGTCCGGGREEGQGTGVNHEQCRPPEKVVFERGKRSEPRGAPGREEDSCGQKEQPEQRFGGRSTLTRVQNSQDAAWLELRRSEETMQGPSSQDSPSQENEGGTDRTPAALTPSANVSQVQAIRRRGQVSVLSKATVSRRRVWCDRPRADCPPEGGATEAVQSWEEDRAWPPKMLR